MTTQTRVKVSAIQDPTPSNTVTVQKQLKESAEVAQRLRGDPGDSYVRVNELTQGGLWRLVNGVLVPGTIGSGGSGTVTTADSVQGNGSSGSPIELVGDSASPGNSQLYGTNSSGTKGWYAQPAGGSNTLAGLTDVSISSPTNGQVLTYVSAASKWENQSASGGVPGTIKDLIFWFESDNILGTSGVAVYNIASRVPWLSGIAGAMSSTSTVTVDSSLLNSLPVLAFTGVSTGRITLFGNGYVLNNGVTIFAVYKPASLTSPSTPTLFSGVAGALQLRTNSSGQLEIDKSNTAVIAASSSSVISVGTWAQFNVTYSAAGAYAFRVARASAGSGTNAVTITAASSTVAWDAGFNGQDLNGSLAALIVYDRVLSGTEISNVESYLNTKWGV